MISKRNILFMRRRALMRQVSEEIYLLIIQKEHLEGKYIYRFIFFFFFFKKPALKCNNNLRSHEKRSVCRYSEH